MKKKVSLEVLLISLFLSSLLSASLVPITYMGTNKLTRSLENQYFERKILKHPYSAVVVGKKGMKEYERNHRGHRACPELTKGKKSLCSLW